MKRVEFSGELEKQINKLAAIEDLSFTEVLTDAVAVYEWVIKVQHEGRVIKAHRVDGVVELLPLSQWPTRFIS